MPDEREAMVVGGTFLHAGWKGKPAALCGAKSRGVATVRDWKRKPGCPACVRLVKEDRDA